MVLDRLPVREAPNPLRELAVRFLHREVDARVIDRSVYFDLRANDAGIRQQSVDFLLSEARDLLQFEPFEGLSEGVALAENGQPGKAGLKSVQHQVLPK